MLVLGMYASIVGETGHGRKPRIAVTGFRRRDSLRLKKFNQLRSDATGDSYLDLLEKNIRCLSADQEGRIKKKEKEKSGEGKMWSAPSISERSGCIASTTATPLVARSPRGQKSTTHTAATPTTRQTRHRQLGSHDIHLISTVSTTR